MQVCDDAELYPDLSENLKKTPAVLDRSNHLNRLLLHNGYAPIFMNMDEQMQLVAGNAMIRAMASQYKTVSEGSGFKEVSNYIEAQEYLADKGVINKGIEGVSQFTDLPVIKLSDLQNQSAGALGNE